MDVTEPIAEASAATPVTKTESDLNAKTEQTMENLENEIDKAYTIVESKFQQLWKDNSHLLNKETVDEQRQKFVKQLNTMKENLGHNKNIQLVTENFNTFENQLKELNLEEKLHIKDISTKANQALDVLDSKLESVEKEASKYVNSFTSFFSQIISITPEQDQPKEKEVLFNSSLNQYANYGTSRYENDLLKLHTDKNYYITKEEPDEPFNVDEKTKEIESLLKKYPTTLTELMNEIVPVEVSYNQFWYLYFKNESELQKLDKQRKELHSKKEDEEFDWDDDDDEHEIETPEKLTLKESKNDKSSEEITKKENENDDDDDEEDDWE
ncbi:uncharacterized protein KGF55_003372 [Candida pseudojiufengensis]|uniref:uncharacterized protein n=1 Tax=Candida pseudojiufengensis TaxID=497109 RepID=UPI002224506A|nr:uncharacterized protein KGF55_003372 [Candida pseudojiufengensis]KAI5962296.1 hypothetical protein KGF55_003372 [Candida pseudojiufengensis]